MSFDLSSPLLRDAMLILGAAGVVIPAFSRLKITPVIGFILAGLLLGPTGLGAFSSTVPQLDWLSISDSEALEPVAEFGIILLLFSIGLELSFPKLWAMRRSLAGLGASELFGGGFLIAGLLLVAGNSPNAALGLGLALSLSSTAIVLPMIKTDSAVGKNALAMLLFEDLALVPIIFFLGILAMGAQAGEASKLMMVAVRGILLVAGLMVVGPRLLPPLFAQAARTKSPELFLAAILLVVVGASIATSVAGLSPIVGALVAGLLIAETRYHGEVAALILPFKGLALGVFLITIGMSLDLTFMAKHWPELLLASASVILIKTLVTGGLLGLAGVRRGIAAETGLLLASPSETTLIVLAAAGQAGLLAAEVINFWTVVTAIGLTLTPLLATLGTHFSKRIDRRQAEMESANLTFPDTPHAIIIGFGRVGQMVASMLERHGQSYVAIEADIDLVSEARAQGKAVRFGDAGRQAFLDRLDTNNATAVVLTMDDAVQAVHITQLLRSRHEQLTIVARARDTHHAAELYKAGATDAVPETLESSLQLAETTLVDMGVAMGPVIASIHEKRDELRATIREAGMLEELPRLGALKRDVA